MWKIERQGLMVNEQCTMTNLSGFQWEISCESGEDEVKSAINLYYHEEAKRGVQNIIERNKYSKKELLERLNIARSVSSTGAAYIKVIEIPTGKTYTVILPPLDQEFTSELLDNWLSNKEKIPYSAFTTMRAAVNDKFMDFCEHQLSQPKRSD